jgi:hypothetical protein
LEEGLEQGFDVQARPASGSGPLTLSLALSSTLTARLDRAGVELHGASGTLRYDGLSASDARGRPLHAWLQLSAGRIVIQVDDRAAAYPVRIDPIIQAAELASSDGATGDALGFSLAIDGDTIVASAPLHKIGVGAQQGALYVFQKPASGWANATQTAELTLSAGAGGQLGDVSISGDTIVAGAANQNVGASESQGAVYVFVRPASGWVNAHQTAELTASDGAAGDGLGTAVGISGDTIVASAPNSLIGLTGRDQGAAYVFVKPPGGWADSTQAAKLTTNDGAAGDSLGNDVAISGDTIALGAELRKVHSNPDQGAGYVYVKPASGWRDMTQTSELTATDGAAGDRLGLSVAISGDTVVLGAPFHIVGSTASGAAYIFVKTFFGWSSTQTQNAELTASDRATNDRFGGGVGISGDRVVVGAPAHQVGANPAQGAAYVFTRPTPVWTDTTETQKLTAADGAAGDTLGDPATISGNLIATASIAHTVGANNSQGAVYLFGLPPTVTIGAPGGGATFTQGQAVAASYRCTASASATITTCTGPVASGVPIDTTTPGQHPFAVHATDTDGLSATQTVTYTVAPGKGTVAHPATKPSITALKQSRSVWRTGGRLAHISSHRRKPPLGTTFSFALNEPARVTLNFMQRTPGRRLHGKCVHPSGSTKGQPRCTQTHAAGTLSLPAHRATNHIRFQGRLTATKRLGPGTYTLTITATDGARQTTTSRVLAFTIVK